jgi:hypothetical protein
MIRLAALQVLVMAATLAACNAYRTEPYDDAAVPGTADAGVVSGDDCMPPADPFAPATLGTGVAFLASDELAGRSSGTAGDRSARAYIEEAFRCVGLAPGLGDAYVQPFVAPDGTAASNVVGYLPGSDPAVAGDIIVVSAHHDHLGTKGGQVYNGANDNASGVVALIAVARAVVARAPRRTIAFIAFGYEEHDGNCEGSEYYVRHAPAALPIDRVGYVVNLDMVGTYAIAKALAVYGAGAGSRGRAILDGLAPTYPALKLTHSGNADDDASDFQAFADRGIPYVYFETADEPCYHKPCDDAARIDVEGMSRIAHLGHDLVLGLAGDP